MKHLFLSFATNLTQAENQHGSSVRFREADLTAVNPISNRLPVPVWARAQHAAVGLGSAGLGAGCRVLGPLLTHHQRTALLVSLIQPFKRSILFAQASADLRDEK
jgi:hypothetical protein